MLETRCIVLEGTKVVEKKATRAAIRMAIRQFEEVGHTVHSTVGVTLAPLLSHCVRNGRAFTLHFLPGGGYVLRRELRDRMSL